jgi:hypothetical protein
MRFNFQLGGMFGQPNDACTTLPEQERASMVEQLANDFFGTTSGMTTSVFTSDTTTIILSFFNLTLYTGSSTN